jgi:ligand-binding SRPBCC domain-containing protein
MRLHAETCVSVPRETVFPFFAEAANLERLTPPWLRFSIQTPAASIRAGAAINYRIRIHGVPVRWESVITRFEPPECFVDEQRRGPYRRWVHTHRFLTADGGTLLVDDVEFDHVGRRLVGWLVARDLRHIFTYRHQALLEIFKQPHPRPAANVAIRVSPV